MTFERLSARPERAVTERLEARPSRSRDDRAELHALARLAQDLEATPDRVASQAVELMVLLGHAETAGLSLIAQEGPQRHFCWQAVAGAWAPHVGRQLTFAACPCSVAVAQHAPS